MESSPSSPPPLPVASLVADLRRLGVRDGDRLMIHASLRKIGAVEGGAAGVLDALDEAVGPRGGLLMILGAVIEHEWVNERPESERDALLADVAPYDPLSSPVLPEVGYLAEAFRTRPGTIVTDNPSGRFAARGGSAEELLRDAPWDDYYGPGSPLERLCALGGRILRMGATPYTTTALHHAEYLADVPSKRRVVRHYKVVGPTGPVVRAVASLDDEHGIVDYEAPGVTPGSVEDDYFSVILHAFLATGRGLRGSVGGAASELLDARAVVDFGARWMTDNLRS